MTLPADVWTEIDSLLAATPHVTLATADATGRPQAATIGVAVADGRELVFDTLDNTRKYANILTNPRVAVVVGWDDHKTLQLEGTVDVLAPGGDDHERLVSRYLERFPEGHQRLSWQGIKHLRIRPTWVRFSDFSEGPRIFETTL